MHQSHYRPHEHHHQQPNLIDKPFKTSSTLLLLLVAGPAMLVASFFCHAQVSQTSGNTQLTTIQTTTNTNTSTKVKNGILAGIYSDKTKIHSFKGVPFAAAPLGPLRWRAPQASADWQGVRQAIDFSNKCMQLPLFDDMVFRAGGTSEDCLYLNVWTPSLKPREPLPVLLYFYGGGFHAGDGSEPRYDGEVMAQNDIVVISANYRLGVFGLLAHPELSAETSYKGSGNYTFMDQAAALQWVVDNVAAFGGDPSRITIGGESAGSLSVSGLMVSPLSKHNIAGAIGQSGSLLGSTLANVPLAQGEQQGLGLATALGKQSTAQKPLSLAQLREMPADELLKRAFETNYQWFMPTIDGYVFEEPPYISYQKRNHAQVPLLAGNNSQEQSFESLFGELSPTVKAYKSILKELYPKQHEDVFNLYPAKTEAQLKDAAQALAGDRWLAFSTWNWANLVSQANPEHVYYYQFSKIRPPSISLQADSVAVDSVAVDSVAVDSVAVDSVSKDRGAVHSAEIEYVFGNLTTYPSYQWDAEDLDVSSTMQAYFANFIKTGNPNGSDLQREELPRWPLMSTNNLINIDTMTRAQSMQQLNDRYKFHRIQYEADKISP